LLKGCYLLEKLCPRARRSMRSLFQSAEALVVQPN